MSDDTKQPRKRTGRPSKLTADITDKLYTMLANHGSAQMACDVAGITLRCFFHWLTKGANGEKGYKEFHAKMQEARGLSQTILVQAIAKDPSWQSKAWLLERRHPKEWGRKDRMEHVGAGGGPIKSEVSTPQINLAMSGSGPNPYLPPLEDEEPPVIEKPKSPIMEVNVEEW